MLPTNWTGLFHRLPHVTTGYSRTPNPLNRRQLPLHVWHPGGYHSRPGRLSEIEIAADQEINFDEGGGQ